MCPKGRAGTGRNLRHAHMTIGGTIAQGTFCDWQRPLPGHPGAISRARSDRRTIASQRKDTDR